IVTPKETTDLKPGVRLLWELFSDGARRQEPKGESSYLESLLSRYSKRLPKSINLTPRVLPGFFRETLLTGGLGISSVGVIKSYILDRVRLVQGHNCPPFGSRM